MIVFSVLGPCGAGKTTMLSKFPGNIRIHKEGYVQKDEATVHIDNRTYLSKLRYVSGWYLEMIKLKKEKYGKILSDRCPYDVCAYVNDQEKQHSMIEEYMRELDSIFHIKVKTIYLRVPFSMAKRRVGDRLAREPWRKNYHEDDDEFLKKTWSYYENHRLDWDHIVDNEESIEKGLKQLIKIVGRQRASARI